MLFKDGVEITSVHKDSRLISMIFKGTILVWEAIRSCFGRGFWINKFGWSNEDGWKNNI